jgi:hypothetical protein
MVLNHRLTDRNRPIRRLSLAAVIDATSYVGGSNGLKSGVGHGYVNEAAS